MDDIEMGGNLDANYIFYVQFDLYTCKNGIDFDEKNPNCTTYEKIIEAAGEDNSFTFDLYYPVVHYQPMVKENPLFVKYANYFYHLSRYSNKIDRLYLKKYKLMDDNGWFLEDEKNMTRWGYESFTGDAYSTGDERDLMNEGSSSRLYSFNIYVNSDVVYYKRSYKKIYLIIANGFPNVNLIFIILRTVAEIFGMALRNKKLTEILFENIQEKPNVISLSKNKKSKSIYGNEKSQTSRLNIYNKKDDSTFNLFSQNERGNSIIKRQISLHNSDKSKLYQNLNLCDSIINNNDINTKKEIHKINENTQKKNINNETLIKNNDDISSLDLPELNFRKINNKKFNEEILKINEKYIRRQLFPYKYFLFSIFLKKNYKKNLNKSFFYTDRFIFVYDFICQLFDISSYMILQREFQILKNIVIMKKYKANIENCQKININDKSFNNDIIECIESNKFSILGKVNLIKNN